PPLPILDLILFAPKTFEYMDAVGGRIVARGTRKSLAAGVHNGDVLYAQEV
ncbi:unnamed protein product, partial [marine sediment metagenome]